MTNGKERKNQFCMHILRWDERRVYVVVKRLNKKKNEPLPSSPPSRSFYLSWNGCFCGFAIFIWVNECIHRRWRAMVGEQGKSSKQTMLSKICLRKKLLSFSLMAQFFLLRARYCSHYYCEKLSRHLSKIDSARMGREKPQEWRTGRLDYDYDDIAGRENCYDSSANIFTRVNEKWKRIFRLCGFPL